MDLNKISIEVTSFIFKRQFLPSIFYMRFQTTVIGELLHDSSLIYHSVIQNQKYKKDLSINLN